MEYFSLFKSFNFILFQATDFEDIHIYDVFTINLLLLEINFGLFELVISKNSYGVHCLMG